MSNLTLKKMIEQYPKCLICQKDLIIYFHFFVIYTIDEKFFKGLGERSSKLIIKDGKLFNKDHWKFDIETGAVESDTSLFNKILTGHRKHITKKCKTCNVSINYSMEFDHFRTYKFFPELNAPTCSAGFDISPNLKVDVYQSEKRTQLSVTRSVDYTCVYAGAINPIDFSAPQTFKNLKNKIKTILAFM